MTTPPPRPELSRADRITSAQLTGTAQRHARAHRELTEDEIAAAIAELLEIATEPYQPPRRGRPGRRRRLRVDLLEDAAGGLLGGWLHSDVSSWDGHAAAQLLIRAGADPEIVQTYAEHVRERLDREWGLPGIGNPNPNDQMPKVHEVRPGSVASWARVSGVCVAGWSHGITRRTPPRQRQRQPHSCQD